MTLHTELSYCFKQGDLVAIRKLLDRLQTQLEEDGKLTHNRCWTGPTKLSPHELFNAQKVFSALSKNSKFKVRVEGRDLAIYSTERDWLHSLAETVNATEWWEPTVTLEPNMLIMGSAMSDWGYKITVGSNVPEEFRKWAIQNKDKIKIGNTFMKSLLNGSKYMSGYYFYVKNERMLTLASLVLGQGIQRVDKIVVEGQIA